MKFSWFKLDTGKLDTVVRSLFSLVGQGFGPVCVGASAKMLGEKWSEKLESYVQKFDFFSFCKCECQPRAVLV